MRPQLPNAVMRAILDDEHVRGDGALPVELRGAFIIHALLGARAGMHARDVHPDEISTVARLGAARLDEPHRSAWLTGFRLGAGDESETPTLPDVRVAELLGVGRS